MSKSKEKIRFENMFENNVIEVAAVTGACGVGSGKACGDIMWNSSIDLIAWKNINNNDPVKKEDVRLKWLVYGEELKKSRDVLKKNTVVRLQVRMGKNSNSMMLVKVLETAYRDDELEIILRDWMKPVFYDDEVFGEFELNKSIKLFEKEISWAGEKCRLYFDWNEDINSMKLALKVAYALLKDQDEWIRKIKMYASEELVELANEWLQDNEDAEIDEITKEMFVNLIDLDSISVYPNGDFEIFFCDGDIFLGHAIIVRGNINGNLTSANIAG